VFINNVDESDETFKQKLEMELTDIKNEKDALAQEQQIMLDIPSSEDARSRRDSTSCEVVMSVENASQNFSLPYLPLTFHFLLSLSLAFLPTLTAACIYT
jgi:hypothetical protein